MKRVFRFIIGLFLMFSSIFPVSALETYSIKNDEYISYKELSNEEISNLLENYKYVTIYHPSKSKTSGTHSTYSITYDKTFAYGSLGYHPDTGDWDTATGYSVSTTKTRSFSMSVTANVTKSVSIFIGVGYSSTTSSGKNYELTDAQKAKVNIGKGLSRLDVYAKVRKQMWHYKVYDNASGQLINEFDSPYVTTWNANGEKGKVSYQIKYKDKK